MSKKKAKRHHKPNAKLHTNRKPISVQMIVEERMNRIVRQMQEMLADPRPLELARDVVAGVRIAVCRGELFSPSDYADDQADKE